MVQGKPLVCSLSRAFLIRPMELTLAQRHLLQAIASDYFLKAHRDLDGHKVYQLHPLQGEPETVSGEDVQALVEAGLIDSNKKFPAATFWLTEQGQREVAQLSQL